MKLERPCTIDELPIPTDARVTRKWTEQMREMAAHIGAYRTLLVVDVLGGQQIDIPSDPASNRMASFLGEEGAAIMSRIYGGNKLWVPVGRAALDEARRAGIIAACREKRMTIAEAAPILRTSRSYLGYLVNKTDEGEEVEPYVPRRGQPDPRQLDMFAAPAPSDDESTPTS